MCQLVPIAQLEQRKLVNATEAPVSNGLLHTLFTSQVPLRHDQVAVISQTRHLTYGEIYTGSLQLAHQLRRLGAGPNQLVAVVMEKGWEQVVGVLGILQSGAAYLPIDPHLPAERLTYLLEHGEVRQVVTQSWIDQKVEWPIIIERICVDMLDLAQPDMPPLESFQQPEDLAYVIYTSGSTGLPKGVMIDHRGAVNTILDINRRFNVTSMDRVLALSALNFDLSVYDIFGLLAAGGSIVIPPDNALRNPAAWLDILIQEHVTLWNSVPALLQMLVDFTENTPEALKLSCLRLAMLSGDWIPLLLTEHIQQLIPGIKVVSLGGATEASIWSILYPINEIDPAWKSIPYGKPMLNQRFAVLNDILEPCPVWVSGNLYISGIGLARGYWRDEEKTKASFILHPRTGERLYRTGDLGRYLPDGTIEFLGREDSQVKIQGHRIELGEIEETLLRCSNVCSAVANVTSGLHGDKRLVAYVVLQQPELSKLNNDHIVYTEEAYTLQQLTEQGQQVVQNNTLQRLELQFGQSNIREDLWQSPIPLAQTELDATAIELYKQRISYRSFLSETITFEEFSGFLGLLRQIELEGLPKYLYPSAGGIYPVQTYLYVKPGGIERLLGGFYYYHPRTHQIIPLAEQTILEQRVHGSINQPIFNASAFSLFLVGQLDTITPVYGDIAHDFCLLEAGYMSQLLMTRAPEYSIGLCPIGSIDFTLLRDLLALNKGHTFLHGLLGGRIDPTQATGWSFLPGTPTQAVSNQQAPTEAMLRDFLKKKLPDYMVPSTIVILDALPLTANGKVDRKHLPEPELATSSPGNFVAPRSQLEHLIASVWQEMLPSAKIGIHDSFFDLGGSSLLMVRAYTKLRKLLDRDVSLVEMFFQYPTINNLVEFLTNNQTAEVSDDKINEQRYERLGSQRSSSRQRQIRLRHRSSIENDNERTEN